MIAWAVVALLVLIIGVLVPAAYKSRVVQTTSGLGGVNEFWDFINGVDGTPFMTVLANGGKVAQGGNSASGRSTLCLLRNSGVSDTAAIMGYDPNNFSEACLWCTTGTSTNLATDMALSGTTGNFSKFVYGVNELYDCTGRGAYFKADFSVSNFWICVRNSNGTPVQTITNVLVDKLGVNFTTLKVIHTSVSSQFFIAGVLVATLLATQPSDYYIAPVAALTSNASGENIQSVWLDYFWLIHSLAVVRPTP